MSAGDKPWVDRYGDYTDEQVDAGAQWLHDQGYGAWSKRLKIEGDYIVGDLRGVPPIVRQMIREQLVAMHQLMTTEQWAEYRQLDTAGRVELVDQILTEAGR